MKRKFTLIEILGVTILIAILAAIGIAGYTYAVESAKESATRALITRVSAALEALRGEGKMFKTVSGGTTAFVTITFKTDPTAANRLKFGDEDHSSDAYALYAKAVSGDGMKRHLNDANVIIDGWGNPIYIRYPGKFNRGGFDIIAAGADGKFGSDEADDPVENSEKYRKDGEWVCDDIANF